MLKNFTKIFFVVVIIYAIGAENVFAYTNIENFNSASSLNQTRISTVSGGTVTMRPLTTSLSNPDFSSSLSSTEAIINSGGNPYSYTGFNDNQHYPELSGYLAWYKFTADGTDESGNYNLTTGGSPTHTSEYYDFEASDGADYLTRADNDNLDFGTSDFTVSVAINIESSDATSGWIVGKGMDGAETASEWFINEKSGSVNFVVHDGVDRTTGTGKITSSITAGEWHILHLIRKNGYIYAFIDGIRVNKGYYAPGNISNTREFAVGSRSDNHDEAFDGQIDEIMMIKRALTYNEILAQVHALKTQADNLTFDADGGVIIDGALPNDELTFPATNLGTAATITFEAKRSNWNNEGSSLNDNALDQSIFYAASSDGRELEIKMDYSSMALYFRKLEPYETTSYGKMYLPINPAIKSFAPNSWHTFTISYDISGFYMEVFIDGVNYSNLPRPQTTANTDPNSTKDNYNTEEGFISAWENWQPDTIWIGNSPSSSGSAAFSGSIRNLNIYNGIRYGITAYPLQQAVIESDPIDSGSAGTQWNRLAWDETLPSKTDIEFQVSTSEDGSTWSPWIGQDKAIVTLSFDDGLRDQYGAWDAYMRERGLVGTAYVMYDSIGDVDCGYGDADCMTESEIDDLAAAGWEIGGHYLSGLTSYTGSALTDLITNIYNELLGVYNWNISTLAYPGGSYTPEVISAVSERFNAARSIEKDFPYMTFNRKFRLTTKASTNSVDWDTYIDKAVAENGWLVMMIHGISGLAAPYNEPGSAAMTSADFDTAMGDIKTRVDAGEIDVLNMQDALDRIMFSDSSGSSLSNIAPGRYVKWRAILSSYDGQNTPILDNVVISSDDSAPTNVGISSITADSASQLTITSQTATDSDVGLHSTPYYFNETSGNSGGSSSEWQSSVNFTDTDLSENTQYSYQVKARDNNSNVSVYSDTALKYTLADSPTNLSASSNSNSVTLSVDSFPNDTSGQSGYYFSRSGGGNSGWIQTNSWTDTGLSCGHEYTYSVKYRNGDGTNTSEISTTKSTSGCGGGGMPAGWGNQPTTPAGGFKITVNQGENKTSSRIVNLKFNAGGSNVAKMAISLKGDFSDASQENYSPTKEIDLCSKFGDLIKNPTCPDGEYTVYVKFYTQYGVPSDVITAKISLVTTPQFTTPTSTFTKDLWPGFKDNQVKILQQFLNQNGFRLTDSGFGSPGNETDFFGSLTSVALAKFQEANKDKATGMISEKGFLGPITRQFINLFKNTESTTTPIKPSQGSVSAIFTAPLWKGLQSNDVRRLQTLLATKPEIYPEGLITGYFGPLTEKAVQNFQLNFEVVTSSSDPGFGYVGPMTRAKLQEVFGNK